MYTYSPWGQQGAHRLSSQAMTSQKMVKLAGSQAHALMIFMLQQVLHHIAVHLPVLNCCLDPAAGLTSYAKTRHVFTRQQCGAA